MPRPNPHRTIAGERSLAQRVATERELRGMTYEGLATRMARAGCPINASGIYKIEKAGRRITVDELLGFSAVFGVKVDDLLLPPRAAVDRVFRDRLAEIDAASREVMRAEERREKAWDELGDYVAAHPDVEPDLEHILRDIYADGLFPVAQEAQLVEAMARLTGSPEWVARRAAMGDGAGE
jgi:transcriptional regulator with XRE-family HTH domain